MDVSTVSSSTSFSTDYDILLCHHFDALHLETLQPDFTLLSRRRNGICDSDGSLRQVFQSLMMEGKEWNMVVGNGGGKARVEVC